LHLAENLLLGPQFQLLLADWGLCARGDVHHERSTSTVGTTYYRAPEVTTACATKPYCAAAADMWSAGVVLFIALTGQPPLETSTPGAGDCRLDIIQSRDTAALWVGQGLAAMPSSGAINLVTRLLAYEPGERPSAQECLLHPWLAAAPEPGVAAAVFDEMFARRRYIQAGAVADASVPPVGDHLFERPPAAAALTLAPAADAGSSGGVAAASACEAAAAAVVVGMDADHSAAFPASDSTSGVRGSGEADGSDAGSDRNTAGACQSSPERVVAPQRAHGVEASSTPVVASPTSPMHIEASPAALTRDAAIEAENVAPAGTGAGAAAPQACTTTAAAADTACGAHPAAALGVRPTPGSALRPRRLASAFAAGERPAVMAPPATACARAL
jgi:hypothetical protein